MDKMVEPPGDKDETGAFGIKRVSRKDPNRWADIIEETLRRQAFHIVVLYILAIVFGAKLVFDLMAWGDYAMTHH